MLILLAIFGAWLAGAIAAWEIYDVDGPKTSNVSAAIIIQVLKHTGKILGTIFWPFVLLLEIADFIMGGRNGSGS